MSFTFISEYTTPSNYTYDTDKIEVSGIATIRRQKDTHQFTQTFDNDTGFVYDNTEVEFAGSKMLQKDSRPANSTVYASFTIDEDSAWGANLNNILVGGATVGSGMVDLTGSSGKRLRMPGSGGNFNTVGNAGCIRFTIIPDYNGLPPSSEQILEYDAVVGNNNAIFISQNTGGNFIIDVRDSSGAAHQFVTSSVSRTIGVPLVCELGFDFTNTTGRTRFFVNGTQRGALNTSAFTRVAENGTFNWGGVSGTGDFYIDDIILFSEVQHTTDHAGELPYSYNETLYVESIVELPKFSHTGTGFIESLDDFVSTENGTFRYNVKAGTGNFQYWDGLDWVDSNGTNTQANDASTMNTNLPSFTAVFGELDVFIKLFFVTNSNTQEDIDFLEMNHTDQEEFYTDNPTIESNAGFRSDQLLDFLEISTKTGSDEIKHILKKGSDWYYFNGSIWTISDETYAQANTAVEIQTNKSSFLTEGFGFDILLRSFLHSEDGSTKPDLDEIRITYDFSGIDPTLTIIKVYSYLRDLKGPLAGETIEVRPVWVIGNLTIITGDFVESNAVTNSLGYWELDMVVEDVDPDYLEWRIKDKIYKTDFVNQPTVKFSEYTILWQNSTEIDVIGTC